MRRPNPRHAGAYATAAILAAVVPSGGAVQTAGVELLLIAAVIIIYGILYLTRPKPKGGVKIDDVPTTLTTRGSTLQVVVGRRDVAPVFCWAGRRQIIETGGGGSGITGFGVKGPKQITYKEAGWHPLCVGPAKVLHKIRERGRIVWEGPIDAESSPSGTAVTTGDGTFVIHWGELDQPINTYLEGADALGVSSRWPSVCSVFWIDKALGPSPRWDQLQYEIETDCPGNVGGLNDSAYHMGESELGAGDDGINPAHAFWQVVTAPSPWGAAIDPALLDSGAIELVGQLLEEEHSPCSCLFNEDTTVSQACQQIMLDHGIALDQVGGALVPILVRPAAGDVPAFDDRHLVNPTPERVTAQVASPPTAAIYIFQNRAKNWKPQTARGTDDATSQLTGRRAPSKQTLDTIIDLKTAQRAADRKQMEMLTRGDELQLKMTYTARDLHPGMAFDLDGYGRLRVMKRRVSTDTAEVGVTAQRDQFSLDPTGFFDGDGGVGDPPEAPEPDIFVRALEVPHRWVGAACMFAVLRIRANETVGSATVWISPDGETYDDVGTQGNWAAGGTLDAALPEKTRAILDNNDWLTLNPVITATNEDIDLLPDLSGNDPAWLGGKLSCLIDDEVMYIRAVTAMGAGKYRLEGVVRGMAGTMAAAHAQAARVWLFRPESVTPLSDPIADPGSTIYVKTQPNGTNLADAVEATLDLVGAALGPLPVDNLRPLSFDAGETWTGSWTYRVRDGKGNAAGEQPAGQALEVDGNDDIVVPPHEGIFKVEFLDPADPDTVLRTKLVDSDAPTTTYSLAERTEDFGADPAEFLCRVTNRIVFGAYSRTITVRKV